MIGFAGEILAIISLLQYIYCSAILWLWLKKKNGKLKIKHPNPTPPLLAQNTIEFRSQAAEPKRRLAFSESLSLDIFLKSLFSH